MLLDSSGSMQEVSADALASVNSFIANAKKDAALRRSSFTLITFNSLGIETLREAQPMSEVGYIRPDEYRPNGMTPLYDAIGRAVGILDEAVGETDAKAVLVIMTDGLENCSREFTRESIQGTIEASQQAGWMVVFLGQGLDVAAQGYALGISANENVVAFQGSAGLCKALSGLTQRIAQEYAESQRGGPREPGEGM